MPPVRGIGLLALFGRSMPDGRGGVVFCGGSTPARCAGTADTTTDAGSATTASTGYAYDLDDMLTGKTTAGGTGSGAHTYTHDGLGLVTSWLSPMH
jgi:YD repeat-containing protein